MTESAKKSVDLSRSISLVSRRTGTGGSNSSDEHPHPAELLYNRLVAWKRVVKDLISYFKEYADALETAARAYNKASEKIEIPFKDAHMFMGKDGVQDLFASVRSATKDIVDRYIKFAKYIEDTIIKDLTRLKEEVKKHIQHIQKDSLLSNNNLLSLREATKRKILELSQSIALAETSPKELKDKHDPFLVNIGIQRLLEKETNEENSVHKALLQTQEKISSFDTYINERLRDVVQAWHEQVTENAEGMKALSSRSAAVANALHPEKEWKDFLARHQSHLLDPSVPFKNAEDVAYSQRDHRLVEPVTSGRLQRKGMMGRWSDRYFVLTPSGFLHEYKSSDIRTEDPENSIYVPGCSLGAHSQSNLPENSFELIEGKKAGLLSREHKHVLRAPDREHMLSWWSSLQNLAEVSMVPHRPTQEATPPPAEPAAAAAATSTPPATEKPKEADAAAAEKAPTTEASNGGGQQTPPTAAGQQPPTETPPAATDQQNPGAAAAETHPASDGPQPKFTKVEAPQAAESESAGGPIVDEEKK
ncbi:uncharacterized protein VTP21DRAFT_4613 [Calcarisporiella thermophila]|uniref:uncharacterized protein n=1 Tax=Calcarisporiella thermophila TaxID=911321 RepID=UPI0037447375